MAFADMSMLSEVDGHVCNLAVNGPCIYTPAADVVQYIDVDIHAEVSTVARLNSGHRDELTWQLMLLVTAWAVLKQIRKISILTMLRGSMCRFAVAGSCSLSLAISRRCKALGSVEAKRVYTAPAGQMYAEWLRRCRRLSIGWKEARRLWKLVLHGLQLQSVGEEAQARIIFDQLAKEVQRRCPKEVREPIVFWTGAHAKLHASSSSSGRNVCLRRRARRSAGQADFGPATRCNGTLCYCIP